MRAIISAAEWTLGAETAEGAPTGIYSAECRTCAAQAQPTGYGCLRDNPYAEQEARGAPSAPVAPPMAAAPGRCKADSPWGQFFYALVLAVLMGALVAGMGR